MMRGMRVVLTIVLLAGSISAQIPPELLSGLEARSIGPAGMSGRVAAIDAVVADPNIVWVGAATGGVWKSSNAGLTWQPVFDEQDVAAIGEVAIFQPNPDIVWVGTGEGNPRNSASVGNGVYRTTDGGSSWVHLGLSQTERIHRIVLHPTNPDVAWVAALGMTWGDNAQRGVFHTKDAGKTWEPVLQRSERTGAADLVADPRDPDKLFAALWDHRRSPHSFRSGGPDSGLHVTRDGGDTWQELGVEHGLPEGEWGRVGIAIARSNPDVVYALIEAERSGLYRSADGGQSWQLVNNDHDIAPRPFYYCDIRVDPRLPDRVYNLHDEVDVSVDGGRTFTPLVTAATVHPDHHAWWIHPEDPELIFDGNDGGVAVSRDRGATWRVVGNLPLAQLYHVAAGELDPGGIGYLVYGGMQDNGSWRGPAVVAENGGIRNHHWQEVGFGDGFGTHPHPTLPDVGFAMTQEGYLHRFDLRTGERRSIRPTRSNLPEGDAPLRFGWNAPLAIHRDSGTIYFGSQFVHRSGDDGETWTTVSDDLTSDNVEWQRQAESGGLTADVTGAENFTTLTAIAPSPISGDVVWAGSDDGRLHVTTDDCDSWGDDMSARCAGVPESTWIAHIEASWQDAGEAYVVFDNHRRADFETYVYRTTDYGVSWQRLATDGVRGYAHVLLQDKLHRELLFLGTEFGLWLSIDGGRSWTPFTHGLPTVAVRSLALQQDAGDLIIGTHGRGIYVIDDIGPLRGLSAEELTAGLKPFPVRDAPQHWVRQTDASRFPGDGEFRGDNRPYGALIRFAADGAALPSPGVNGVVGEAPRVRVEVMDAAKERVCVFERPVVRGINTVVWNLRRDGFRPFPGEEREDGALLDPHGPEVPPGDYTVRLVLGVFHPEVSVKVLADPRLQISAEDRAANEAAVLQMGAWKEELIGLLDRLEDARADIGRLLEKVDVRQAVDPTDDRLGELVQRAQTVRDRVDGAYEALAGPRARQGVHPRNHPRAAIAWAMRSLASSWRAPTDAQKELMDDAQESLRTARAEAEAVLTRDVSALAEQARAAGIGWLAPPAQGRGS